MKIVQENWLIKNLIIKKAVINPKPQYQRTPVWSTTKKIFLIDSILRNYDLPKFYVKNTLDDPVYDFEITDGQQRMRAIWEFHSNEFKLVGKEINSSIYKGCNFRELPDELKSKFENFELNISIIKESTQEEIRTLFARLQMGMTLIPVELRHAFASNIGNAIFMIAENHKFFNSSCRIINTRFKHQDYLDHVIALIYFNNEKDLKAPLLYQLYIDLSSAQSNELSVYLKKVNKILIWMHETNKYAKGIFANKWGFVDSFWLLHNLYDKINSVNYKKFAYSLLELETIRKDYNSKQEELIEDKQSTKYDKDLYDYIEAFNRQGALKKNISIRFRVFNNKFNNKLNFNKKNG